MFTSTWTLTFVIATTLPTSMTQEIHLHDFNNNNGYTKINLGKVKIIKSYTKVLHVINITEFERTTNHIRSNILSLESKLDLIGPMYNTINQSLVLLDAKIENIKPHSETKRALMNILGTGLKYLADTMDHDDKTQIKNK